MTRKFAYRHDEHYTHTEELHKYADVVLDHVWTGLVMRSLQGRAHSHTSNRAYARSMIRRAIAATDTITGEVETDNNVCLRFSLTLADGSRTVTLWIQWDQIKGDLRTAGYPLDI